MGVTRDHPPRLIQLAELQHLVIMRRTFILLITQDVNMPLLIGRDVLPGG